MSSTTGGPASRLLRHAPDLVALACALLIGAPFLARGTVIAYDLAWVPRPRWTPFVLGVGIPAPRAVPSDAVAVLLGRLIGAGLAEALLVVGSLALAGMGAARLLAPVGLAPESHDSLRMPEPCASPRRESGVKRKFPASGDKREAPGLGGRCVAAAVAVWNPFVAERLAIGHWTVLLAYAVLPWLVRAAVRHRAGIAGSWPVLAWLAGSGVGGANALIITAPVVLIVVLWPGAYGGRWSPRAGGLALLVAAGSAAAWALPALLAGVAGDPAGTRLFAARADTPYGLFGSALSGGALWSQATHAVRGPAPLTGVLTLGFLAALVVALPRLVRSPLVPLVGAGLLGLLLVTISGSSASEGLWSWLLSAVPGGGVLRDSQKLLAPWMLLVALAVGVAVHRVCRLPALRAAAPVLAIAATLLPLALQPTFAWGLGGRLVSSQVPAEYLATTAALSGREAGLVGLLPWNQYRRYPWNGERVALTVAPRLVGQQVLANDALPTRSGWVAGEDPRSAAVSAEIAAGADPVEALRRQGVRYVLIETDAAAGAAPDADAATGSGPAAGASPLVPDSLAGQVPIASGPSAAAYDLGPSTTPLPSMSGPVRAGWALTLATWLLVSVGALPRWRSARAGRARGGRATSASTI